MEPYVWFLVAIIAGTTEEILHGGYLQKQLHRVDYARSRRYDPIGKFIRGKAQVSEVEALYHRGNLRLAG